MAITDPVPEMPVEFMAGTTVKLKRSLSDFPATAGWVLTLSLAGKVIVSFTSSPSGSEHLITMPATGVGASTDDLTPGVYQWVEKAELAGEVYETARGYVTVTPDLESGAANQFQEWAEKVLELIEARIAGRVVDGADMAAYRIGDREVSQIPINELLGIRNTLKNQLNARAAGGRFSREVVMQFTGRIR